MSYMTGSLPNICAIIHDTQIIWIRNIGKRIAIANALCYNSLH